MAFASDSTTAPARPLLALPTLDRSAIGRDGWVRARLAEGLRQAWRAARAALGFATSAEPEPLLPAPTPLPSLSAALSRRRALFGAVTLATVPATALPAMAHSTPLAALSANDARLVALADAYEAVDRSVHATSSATPGFDDLISSYSDLEAEAAETPADSLTGALAKVRLCRSPAARGCAGVDHLLSALDDVWRLHPAGGLV